MAKKKATVEVPAIEDIQIDGMSFSSATSRIITEDGVFKIELMPDLDTADRFDDEHAYLKDKYFYLFRGIGNMDTASSKKPGIYKNRHASPKYFLVDPRTDKEKEEYDVVKNICSLQEYSIIDTANSKEDLLIAIPESTRIFQPPINDNDDILKLLAKKALLAKNVDLDQHKDRFANKNELFNFKQVLRGDNKLSIRIFERGMEALNLKYTITLTEKGTTDVVGNPLTDPISVSSEETYDM